MAEFLRLSQVSGVKKAITSAGPTLLYLPPYSPDLNPIEKFFSKLKSPLRKAAKRSVDAPWTMIGTLLEALTPSERSHYFLSCQYVHK